MTSRYTKSNIIIIEGKKVFILMLVHKFFFQKLWYVYFITSEWGQEKGYYIFSFLTFVRKFEKNFTIMFICDFEQKKKKKNF